MIDALSSELNTHTQRQTERYESEERKTYTQHTLRALKAKQKQSSERTNGRQRQRCFKATEKKRRTRIAKQRIEEKQDKTKLNETKREKNRHASVTLYNYYY